MIDPRITELIELAQAERIALPYPPATIVAIEEIGAIVDLRTGVIEHGPGTRVEPTVVAEAVLVALRASGFELVAQGGFNHFVVSRGKGTLC